MAFAAAYKHTHPYSIPMLALTTKNNDNGKWNERWRGMEWLKKNIKNKMIEQRNVGFCELGQSDFVAVRCSMFAQYTYSRKSAVHVSISWKSFNVFPKDTQNYYYNLMNPELINLQRYYFKYFIWRLTLTHSP